MAPFYDHLLMRLAYELFYANHSLRSGDRGPSALCFQAADTSGEQKTKKNNTKKAERSASVGLPASSFVGVCGPADGSLQLSGPKSRREGLRRQEFTMT